jgi:hypothetical protein
MTLADRGARRPDTVAIMQQEGSTACVVDATTKKAVEGQMITYYADNRLPEVSSGPNAFAEYGKTRRFAGELVVECVVKLVSRPSLLGGSKIGHGFWIYFWVVSVLGVVEVRRRKVHLVRRASISFCRYSMM